MAAPLTPSTCTVACVQAFILGDGCLTGTAWSQQPDCPHTSHRLGPKLCHAAAALGPTKSNMNTYRFFNAEVHSWAVPAVMLHIGPPSPDLLLSNRQRGSKAGVNTANVLHGCMFLICFSPNTQVFAEIRIKKCFEHFTLAQQGSRSCLCDRCHTAHLTPPRGSKS